MNPSLKKDIKNFYMVFHTLFIVGNNTIKNMYMYIDKRMKKHFIYFLVGMVTSIIASYVWFIEDKKQKIITPIIIMCFLFILCSAYFIIIGLDGIMDPFSFSNINVSTTESKWYEKAFIILLIYMGSAFYVIASYYHLKIKQWSFWKALVIDIPFVFLEYQLSLRGNFNAHHILKMNPMQVMLVTMICYFINITILNLMVLNHDILWSREILAFILILGALALVLHQ